MFRLSLFYDKHNEEGKFLNVIAIRCSNFNKNTGLHFKNTTIEEMITKFVLNAILHHVGMSWVICSKNEIYYEIEENNHPDWLNKGPWYNTAIGSKFHRKLFGDFITNAGIYRYHLMCSIVAHDIKKTSYEDEEISIGDRKIPNNATAEVLESLVATLKFIYFWFKLCHHNYEVRCGMYNKAMKKLFKKIPTIK